MFLDSTTQHCMLKLQDGDRPWKLAPNHINMCRLRLSHLETSWWLVEIFLCIINLNIIQTGDDTETLRKVEALIQAGFKNGIPPHLQPNAKSMGYSPGSDQSWIFVASHSEFLSMGAMDIQSILHERIILVHCNPLDYSYGWDLESFGRLYDIDKKVSVQGRIGLPYLKRICLKLYSVSTLVHPIYPHLCHCQATL